MLKDFVGIVFTAATVHCIGFFYGIETTAIWCLFVNFVAFVPAYLIGTEKFYDVTGSFTFVTAVISSFGGLMNDLNPGEAHNHPLPPRSLVATLCVAVWACRLGYFLVRRVGKHGDSRFDKVKGRFLTFLLYWTVQAMWCFVTAAPVYLLNKRGGGPEDWFFSDYVGILMFVLGFALEVVADQQKTAWKKEAVNEGKWIDVGLWSYSRHPNYVGEWMLWIGISMLCSAAFPLPASASDALALVRNFSTNERSSYDFLVLIAPAWEASLMLFASGVPLLEKAADKKWGKNPAYIAYKKRVPCLFPGF